MCCLRGNSAGWESAYEDFSNTFLGRGLGVVYKMSVFLSLRVGVTTALLEHLSATKEPFTINLPLLPDRKPVFSNRQIQRHVPPMRHPVLNKATLAPRPQGHSDHPAEACAACTADHNDVPDMCAQPA